MNSTPFHIWLAGMAFVAWIFPAPLGAEVVISAAEPISDTARTIITTAVVGTAGMTFLVLIVGFWSFIIIGATILAKRAFLYLKRMRAR